MDILAKNFRETSFHTMDAKGRIIIPTRFREAIRMGGDTIVVTRMDSALTAYTLEEWGKIESKVLALAETSPMTRRFRRFYIGGASECVLDRQGRVLIAPMLRQYADLKKEVVIIGQINHFEIWDRQRFEADSSQADSDINTEEFSREIDKLAL